MLVTVNLLDAVPSIMLLSVPAAADIGMYLLLAIHKWSPVTVLLRPQTLALGKVRCWLVKAYEAVLPTALPPALKELLAFFPSEVMAAKHTTMISESITEYSTAVGPSSRWKKVVTN